MTPDELQALDRMLAEKVMGWVVVDGYLASHAPQERPPESWHPTTDIAQAFMVAEKIGGLELIETNKIRWKASVGNLEGYFRADTPALAICLAAQAWLERGGDAKCT